MKNYSLFKFTFAFVCLALSLSAQASPQLKRILPSIKVAVFQKDLQGQPVRIYINKRYHGVVKPGGFLTVPGCANNLTVEASSMDTDSSVKISQITTKVQDIQDGEVNYEVYFLNGEIYITRVSNDYAQRLLFSLNKTLHTISRVPSKICEDVDFDNDGVFDTQDQCPDTPEGVLVDEFGCKKNIDSDKDGVLDDADKCPNTAEGVKVDLQGCPVVVFAPVLDKDGDGVLDSQDLCLDTPKDEQVNGLGCSKILVKPLGKRININFDTAKSLVKPLYFSEIESIAKLAAQYPAATIEIQGHTDNKGKTVKNLALSQARADAVRDILIKKFALLPSQVVAKGYGSSQPLTDNKTTAGRAQNRRVMAVFETEVRSFLKRESP